jgi:hypothetical protein
MPLGGAQTGADPSATPALVEKKPGAARARTQAGADDGERSGAEPSGRGKPIARVWRGYASARGER